MASLGSFGVSDPQTTGKNYISRTKTQTTDVAYLMDKDGHKLEVTTHGSETRASEEFFVGAAIPSDLTADDDQNGISAVVSDAVNENATDYAKETIETLTVPGP